MHECKYTTSQAPEHSPFDRGGGRRRAPQDLSRVQACRRVSTTTSSASCTIETQKKASVHCTRAATPNCVNNVVNNSCATNY